MQDPEDAARLRSTGEPWPTAPDRAHLGTGVYAWDNIESAKAYWALKTTRGITGLEIVSFEVDSEALANLNQINVDSLADPDAFLDRYSSLRNATPDHGYEYIIRGTQLGNENFFASSIFHLLSFK
ncbi:MAG: hypothetical protein ABI947_29555 [Chloroflexota bacterium]